MANWAFGFWMLAIASILLWSVLQTQNRKRSMAELANRLGLKSWGNRLPPELSLSGTPIARASATWNVFEGIQNHVPVIVFDCRMGAGKSSWRRTVIAARADRDVFETIPSDSSYVVDRSGEWMVFYAPKRGFIVGSPLMPIAELEARLSTLGK